MVQSLGSLGTVHDRPDFVFDYFGATIRVNPELGEDIVLELSAAASGIGDDTGAADLIALKRTLVAAVIHPEDVDAVLAAARANHQNTEDLSTMAYAIIGAITDRPTSQPSDSSDGLLQTGPRSVDDSSLRVQRRFEAKGRPDLALMVVQAREFEAARSA